MADKVKTSEDLEIAEAEEMEVDMEELAFHAVKQMRKGFISAMILAILREGNNHGYGIMKEIEEKTQGILTPMVSSIYPVLKDLTTKKLVRKVDEKEAEGKTRKIYSVTEKGERMLKHLVRNYQKMISNLRAITMGAFGFDGNYPLEDHLQIMAEHAVFGWKDGKSEKEKEENLIFYRNLIEERIINLGEMKEEVIKELNSLK